jgi:MFS family permease
MIDDAIAKRAAIILAIAQGLYSSATVILIATAGLVGTQIAPSKAWATVPVSAFVIGTALTTIPASMLMKRIGRRAGFMLGALVGFLGAVLAIYAVYQRHFPLFCLAAVLQGVFQASSQFFRFAAADAASPAFKPKAISWVLTGGVAATVFGTLIVMATTDLLAPVTFAGCYVAMAVLSLATVAVLAFLKLPAEPTAQASGPSRPLSEIIRQPRLIVAVATAMLAYGMMNLVMTATPIAMVDCGFNVKDASWVIQWHALAMFVPSFFTGHLIRRFGVEIISAIGMVLLAAAGIAGLAGISFENFAIGLILLGLGWNFGFIGGTTMLTDCYRPAEKNKVQALNDFTIFAVVATASLTSGKLLDWFGWGAVNIAVFPAVALALVMLGWLYSLKRLDQRPA